MTDTPSSIPARACPAALLVLAAALSLSACTLATTGQVHYPHGSAAVVVAPMAPPPPQREIITLAPGPGYVWIDGYWVWEYNRYAWRPGYWAAQRRGHAWVPPRWHRGRGGWHHEEGYWRR